MLRRVRGLWGGARRVGCGYRREVVCGRSKYERNLRRTERLTLRAMTRPATSLHQLHLFATSRKTTHPSLSRHKPILPHKRFPLLLQPQLPHRNRRNRPSSLPPLPPRLLRHLWPILRSRTPNLLPFLLLASFLLLSNFRQRFRYTQLVPSRRSRRRRRRRYRRSGFPLLADSADLHDAGREGEGRELVESVVRADDGVDQVRVLQA